MSLFKLAGDCEMKNCNIILLYGSLLFLTLFDLVWMLELKATGDQLFFGFSKLGRLSFIWAGFVHKGSAFPRLLNSIDYPFRAEILKCTLTRTTIQTFLKAYFRYPLLHQILFPTEKVLTDEILREELLKFVSFSTTKSIKYKYNPGIVRLPDNTSGRQIVKLREHLNFLSTEPWKIGSASITFFAQKLRLKIPSLYLEIDTNPFNLVLKEQKYLAVKKGGDILEWLPNAISRFYLKVVVPFDTHTSLETEFLKECSLNKEMHPVKVSLYNILLQKDWTSNYDSILKRFLKEALKANWPTPDKALVHTRLFLTTCESIFNSSAGRNQLKNDPSSLKSRFYSLIAAYKAAEFTAIYIEPSIECFRRLGLYIDEDTVEIEKDQIVSFDNLFWRAGKPIGNLTSFAHAWKRKLVSTGKHLATCTQIKDIFDLLDSFGAFEKLAKVLVVRTELFKPVYFIETETICYTMQCYLVNATMLFNNFGKKKSGNRWNEQIAKLYVNAYMRLLASNILYRGAIGVGIEPSGMNFTLRQLYSLRNTGTRHLLDQVGLCEHFPLSLLENALEMERQAFD